MYMYNDVIASIANITHATPMMSLVNNRHHDYTLVHQVNETS